MEEQILVSLNFDLQYSGPLPFLDRYLRIYNLDQVKGSERHISQLQKLSRRYCRYMQRESKFLDYRPSQIAAASLMLALNVSMSKVAPAVGAKRIQQTDLRNLFFETSILMEVSGVKVEESNSSCPLRMWNQSVEKITLVNRKQDIEPVYEKLTNDLNMQWYDNKLRDDQQILIMQSYVCQEEPARPVDQ